MYNFTHILIDWKTCDETQATTFHKMFNVTHKLVVIGEDVMRLLSQNVDITHILLVIGKNLDRLPFAQCTISLTSCK